MLWRANRSCLDREFTQFDNPVGCLLHHLLEQEPQVSVRSIIRGGDVFHSIGMRGELITFPETGTLWVIRIINRDGLPPVFLHHSEAWDISRPVPYINHIWKRDRSDFRVHVIIHVLRHVEQALVNSKQELGLLGVADNALGESDSPLFILVKFAAENGADIRLQTAAFDQNLYPGRNNVMLNRNPVSTMLLIQETVGELFEHFW